MTTNAPVEQRHKMDAKALCTGMSYVDATANIAQTLANLEAANNRLAEIDRIARCNGFDTCLPGDPYLEIVALASGHTPSPCPGCAAKDEALEAFKADLSDTLIEYYGGYQNSLGEDLSRFIIPPADPVAEALKAEALAIVLAESITRTDHQIEAIRSGQAGQGKVELALTALKRGLELSRRGGEK